MQFLLSSVPSPSASSVVPSRGRLLGHRRHLAVVALWVRWARGARWTGWARRTWGPGGPGGG